MLQPAVGHRAEEYAPPSVTPVTATMRRVGDRERDGHLRRQTRGAGSPRGSPCTCPSSIPSRPRTRPARIAGNEVDGWTVLTEVDDRRALGQRPGAWRRGRLAQAPGVGIDDTALQRDRVRRAEDAAVDRVVDRDDRRRAARSEASRSSAGADAEKPSFAMAARVPSAQADVGSNPAKNSASASLTLRRRDPDRDREVWPVPGQVYVSVTVTSSGVGVEIVAEGHRAPAPVLRARWS